MQQKTIMKQKEIPHTTALRDIVCNAHNWLALIGEYHICIDCGHCEPTAKEKQVPMRPLHYIILEDIRKQYPQHFMRNRTSFFYSEMYRYIYEKKVFRITVMGETRGGKSETAQTIGINYTRIFNALFKKGHFKKVVIEIKDGEDITKLPVEVIELTDAYIHANQSVYLYYLRDCTREKRLRFGQMHIVDEDRDNIGGIGSFSEEMEIENLNNIVAKFCQCEIWITPKRFQTMNTPYGLNCFIKDESSLMNWCLIYKIEMGSAGLREQNFLGWVGIALHNDTALRTAYDRKKDSWIQQELTGNNNERAVRRMKAIEYLLTDENFNQHTMGKDGNVKWHFGIDSMKFLVEKAILDKKIDQFNETEIERIVHGARALGETRLKGG